MTTSPTASFRSPLSSRTNSSASDTDPSPHNYVTARTSMEPRVRPKVSLRLYHPNADSSETDPSEHSSIFEAIPLPPGLESIADVETADSQTRETGRPLAGTSHEDSTRPAVPLSEPATVHKRREPWIGTQLDTITERTSVATLKPLPSLPAIGQHPSAQTLKPRAAAPRKPSFASLPDLSRTHLKASFSLDDLSLSATQTRHARTAGDKSSSSETAPGAYTLPAPNEPLHPPPHRVPTPPGLPTFNTRAAYEYRIPTPSRLRHLFSFSARRTPSPSPPQQRIHTVGLPRGVVLLGDNGVAVRGRWRPSQSAHTPGGPLSSHPFHRAQFPVAPPPHTVHAHRASVDVEAPPRASSLPAPVPRVYSTAEAYRPHPAPELRPASELGTENRPARDSWQQVANRSRWDVFCDVFCKVCCGLDDEDGDGGDGDDGAELRRVRRWEGGERAVVVVRGEGQGQGQGQGQGWRELPVW